MSRLYRELFPRSAVKFDCSPRGEAVFTFWCHEHGWSPGGHLFLLADDLCRLAASWRENYDFFSSPKVALTLYRFREEFHSMANRKVRDSRVQRATWQGFLDYRLSEAQLDGLDEWSPPLADVWEKVDALLLGNYRVTLSYNAQFKTATCTILDDDPTRKTGGYGLASSDSSGDLALKAALYKHFVVLEGSWERLLDQPLTPGRRG